jgi:hydrogenase maturation protein HypF
MGGDLKSAFCLYHDDRAYISQYFGDMENPLVSKAYQENIVRMESLFGIRPEAIACDLHPLYFTTGIANKLAAACRPAIPVIPIQHHHAHAASVMAEHDLDQAIGVIFDGTGYGPDGAIWGGEFLLCRGRTYERLAHLGYVTLCGGDLAARSARLASQCYIIAGEPGADEGQAVMESVNDRETVIKTENKERQATGTAAGSTAATADSAEMDLLRSAIRHRVNTSRTSSMGRLFDAVSAVLGIRDENTFEAECAIALENAAAEFAENGRIGVESEAVHFDIATGPQETVIDQVGLFNAIRSLVDRVEPGALAYAFHIAIAEMVRRVCLDIRDKTRENNIVLSGGVFANLLLLQECMRQLEDCGFRVHINAEVPTNDGGICLGQAWLCRDGSITKITARK